MKDETPVDVTSKPLIAVLTLGVRVGKSVTLIAPVLFIVKILFMLCYRIMPLIAITRARYMPVLNLITVLFN